MGARLRAIFTHWREFVLNLGTCVLILSMTGCERYNVRDYCLETQYIRPTKNESLALSDQTAKQILAANELRANLCK
jgi:hypothetical protein